MHRFIFLAIVALASLAITWRGRKFSGWALVLSLITDFVVAMTYTDHASVPEGLQIAAMWAMGVGLFGQIFLSIWYATVPSTCPKCGNVGHFSQRPESV